MKPDISISVVIPCFNEGRVLAGVIRNLHGVLVALLRDFELIVVDDCSTDDTPRLLEQCCREFPELRVLRPERNAGHGPAIVMGYRAATKDFVFQIDSDDQFDPADLGKLYRHLPDYRFVLGFREKRHDPFQRLILSRFIRAVNYLLFGAKIRDVNCPFRLIQRELLMEILHRIPEGAFAPNIMISISASVRAEPMLEVPVLHRARPGGGGSLTNLRFLSVAWTGFWQLLEFRRGLRRDRS